MPIIMFLGVKIFFKLLTFFLFRYDLTILIAELFIALFYKHYKIKNKVIHNERFFKRT